MLQLPNPKEQFEWHAYELSSILCGRIFGGYEELNSRVLADRGMLCRGLPSTLNWS